MGWDKLKSIVGKVAPLLGTAIGGPGGAIVGSLIADVLGVENTPNAVEEAIRNDPEAAIKLKRLQVKEQDQIREHLYKTLDVELKDKQSAREMHQHNPMPAILVVSLTVLVGIGAFMLFMVEIPESNRAIAYLLFGTLLAKWGDSIAYWVGTTRSSAEKNKLLGK